MEVVLSTFNKFLVKNGIIDTEGLNHLNKLGLRDQSRHSVENYESLLINNLADYLKNTYKYKPHSLTNSIFEKFISQDDEKILKTIRKLFIIYQSKLRKLIQNYFLNWNLKSHKLKLLNVTIRNEPIYKKKKLYDITMTKNENNNNGSELINKDMTLTSRSEGKQMISTGRESLSNNQKVINEEEKEKNYIKAKNENLSTGKKKETIYDKLYKDKERRDVMKNEFAKNYRQTEVKECTFSPAIRESSLRKSRSKKTKPHYLCLYEDRKVRDDHLRHLSAKKEKRMNDIYTFSPKVNKDFKLKNISTEFFERIKMYSSSKNSKIKEIKEEVERNLPRPRICRTAQSPLIKSRDNSLANVSTTKTERLVDYHTKKQDNIRKIQQNMLSDQGITFKPRLNQSINDNINSSLLERNEDFIRNKSIKLMKISNKDDVECTFSPKINKNFIPLLEESNVGKRLYQYKTKYEKNKEFRKGLHKENYSFKPEINSNTYDILKQRDAIIEEIKSKYMLDSKTEENKNSIENESKETFREINELKEHTEQNVSFLRDQDPLSLAKESKRESEDMVLNDTVQDQVVINSLETPKESSQVKLHRFKYKLQNISDSHLLDLANQYVTTDQSLELFQSKLKEKGRKLPHDKIEVLIKDKFETIGNNHFIPFNNTSESTYVIDYPKQLIKKNSSKTKIAKNISKALELYSIVES